MPLGPVGLSAYHFTYDNWGTNPAATPGTSIVPGASNAEGAFTQVASSANIAQDCYWMHVRISGGATSAQAKPQVFDIGVDPAGGSSYTAVISNISCGASPAFTVAGSKEYLFPIFIKAGSSVAIRVQGTNATAGTVRAVCKWWGQPSMPEAVPVGTIFQTFGTITGSSGPTFTPGNAANGTWLDLGATTSELWWWQMSYHINNATITAEYTYIDIAYGDGSNKHIISRDMHVGTTGETNGLGMNTGLLACSAFKPVPSGANIYIRGRCNNAPDSTYTATVIGCGG